MLTRVYKCQRGKYNTRGSPVWRCLWCRNRIVGLNYPGSRFIHSQRKRHSIQSTRHACMRLVTILQYFYIFNLFFPLGVHLYLSGWHLISFYYIVLPLFKSKVAAGVTLILSLMMSLDFLAAFLFNSRASILSVVFCFLGFKSFTCCLLLVQQWHFSV